MRTLNPESEQLRRKVLQVVVDSEKTVTLTDVLELLERESDSNPVRLALGMLVSDGLLERSNDYGYSKKEPSAHQTAI